MSGETNQAFLVINCKCNYSYQIYWEEASQRHSEAALLYTFGAAESAMRKSRRKQLPQPPENIGELSDVLMNSMLFRVHSGPNRDQFYQTTLTLDDAACVIFIHMKTLAALGRVEELQLNMALDTPATSTTTAYHLLFVHAINAHQVSASERNKASIIFPHFARYRVSSVCKICIIHHSRIFRLSMCC